MDILRRHERFEIAVLEKLNSARFLDDLVFGGGTMLRLCHELNRFSADLDFWFIKKIDQEKYFEKLCSYMAAGLDVTDAQIKHFTILVELRSKDYPKRLKIEIRKETGACDHEKTIAFSKFSTMQVMLRAHTLAQTMRNKVEAALARAEIRDLFDIEFLLRRGIALGASPFEKEGLIKLTSGFKPKDFSVTLGSVLEAADRKYYIERGFAFLLEKLRLSR